MTTFQSGIGGNLILQTYAFLGGPLQDLDATPTITITNLNTSAVVLGPTAVGVTHPSTGTYVYAWTAPVPATQYLVVWDGLSGGNPEQASEIITIVSSSAIGDGPCAWALGTGCCDGWDDLDSTMQEQATQYATLVLWAATGRQYGECQMVVRPCGRFCDNNTSFYYSDGFWVPYISGGVWRNCWCGSGEPSCFKCKPNCQVWLPGPVSSIQEVLLDGAVVDPDTYRVDDGVWLVRTKQLDEEDCWPQCQNYDLPVTEEHTFQVTYTRGKPVPAALTNAAKTLACEYVKACQGQACALPGRVQNIARQGVSVTMASIDDVLKHGLTGIKTVDDVIMALNPYGLKGQTMFYSPDGPSVRTTTWP